MPSSSVSLVSAFAITRSVGSSRVRRRSPSPKRSRSAAWGGETATAITPAGTTVPGSRTGFSGSHSVSPVPASRSPTTATIAPGPACSIASRRSACMR